MPDDAKEEESLWRALEDPVLECNFTRIWMAITDYQEEGKFINVSRFTHTDVFVDNAIVGSTLNDERWGENQPGGGKKCKISHIIWFLAQISIFTIFRSY